MRKITKYPSPVRPPKMGFSSSLSLSISRCFFFFFFFFFLSFSLSLKIVPKLPKKRGKTSPKIQFCDSSGLFPNFDGRIREGNFACFPHFSGISVPEASRALYGGNNSQGEREKQANVKRKLCAGYPCGHPGGLSGGRPGSKTSVSQERKRHI